MGYSTRRKSLNLSDMGIIAPKRSRTASHPSPPETVVEADEPAVKRSKRSHGSASPPPDPIELPRALVVRTLDSKAQPSTELSPPPSPVVDGSNKVDTEGINDDVVVATIQQLERTGNRPHLVRHLAAILASSTPAVEKSANPSALISSRLTTYLNRPWPAISPCPLTKAVSDVHPRRLHFFLTTMPAQPINDTLLPLPCSTRVISPSLSSASIDEPEEFVKDRRALSPSPEVDLSTPELDYENANPSLLGSSFTHEQHAFAHPRRQASPPLETEERDFKQTASALHEQAQARRESPADVQMTMNPQDDDVESITMSIEGDNGIAPFPNSLPNVGKHVQQGPPTSAPWVSLNLTSPLQKPLNATGLYAPGGEVTQIWENLLSPECVELDELENMFDSY